MIGRWETALVLAAVLLVGCAGLQNTPEQELTWAAWDACKAAGRVTHWQIERVDPDGTIRWIATGSPYGLQEIEACMKEEWAKRK
jgi:hypothetical protein